jgi:hypothetical protein
MPKLGEYEYLLRCVVFIYPTRAHAEAGKEFGGSGFLVAWPSEIDPDGFHHLYVVTNAHVAKGERRALRVNVPAGGFDVVEVDEWFLDENGPDIAIAPIDLNPQRHAVEALRADSFLLTEERCRELAIDAGDDTFMVGRFVDYDGVDESTVVAVREHQHRRC